MARTKFKPPAYIVEKAHAYAEELFNRFGLANPDTPTIAQHPELRSLQIHDDHGDTFI